MSRLGKREKGEIDFFIFALAPLARFGALPAAVSNEVRHRHVQVFTHFRLVQRVSFVNIHLPHARCKHSLAAPIQSIWCTCNMCYLYSEVNLCLGKRFGELCTVLEVDVIVSCSVNQHQILSGEVLRFTCKSSILKITIVWHCTVLFRKRLLCFY